MAPLAFYFGYALFLYCSRRSDGVGPALEGRSPSPPPLCHGPVLSGPAGDAACVPTCANIACLHFEASLLLRLTWLLELHQTHTHPKKKKGKVCRVVFFIFYIFVVLSFIRAFFSYVDCGATIAIGLFRMAPTAVTVLVAFRSVCMFLFYRTYTAAVGGGFAPGCALSGSSAAFLCMRLHFFVFFVRDTLILSTAVVFFCFLLPSYFTLPLTK